MNRIQYFTGTKNGQINSLRVGSELGHQTDDSTYIGNHFQSVTLMSLPSTVHDDDDGDIISL